MNSRLLRLLPLSWCALLLPALSTGSRAGDETPYRFGDEVSAWVAHASRQDVRLFEELGIQVEGVFGDRVRVHAPSAARLERLRDLGFKVREIPAPLEMDSGLRADYRSHAQLSADLQAIAAAHPDLCQLYSIGDSVQGRELWFLKISDNVAEQEDEPEFKYISSMHGDEVVGMELCMNLISLLVDDYGSDPRITALVDEVEIWIMPLMNPDGYTFGSRYNAQGVDLNRGFPDRIDDPYNTTSGRATEVAHVMNWAFEHSSVLSANFHGGAMVVNYPYDSDANPWATYSATPEDDLFIAQSLTYSTLNVPMYNSFSFPQGITNGVEWYSVYGGMQDWNYEWLGCNEVTIELSNSKWPPYSAIAGLWDDNRDSMLSYMEWCLKGVRGVVTDVETGQPVDATVRVRGIDHEVRVDPDVGDYHRMLLPGTYALKFEAEGYQKQVVTGVVVGSGDATRLDVVMWPSGPRRERSLK